MEQADRILGAQYIKRVCVDRGYNGHTYQGKAQVLMTGKKQESNTLKKLLKRRSSIEAVISHLKSGCRMGRNYLLGVAGDKMNARMSASGWNFRLLLALIRLVSDFRYFCREFVCFIPNS